MAANALSGLRKPNACCFVGRISAAPFGKTPLLGLLHHLQQRIQQAGKTDIQIFTAQ